MFLDSYKFQPVEYSMKKKRNQPSELLNYWACSPKLMGSRRLSGKLPAY